MDDQVPADGRILRRGLPQRRLRPRPRRHAPSWERVRIVAVAAFTLTSLALVATLLELDTFAFGEGGLTEAVAWIWLAVYVALPPAVLVAFIRQERLVREPVKDPTALPASRLVCAVAGAVIALLGIGLFADWGWLVARWPWPLPSLPARVVGTWLCTYAAVLLWFALRERSWLRGRLGVVSAVIALSLDIGAAVRYSSGLDQDASHGRLPRRSERLARDPPGHLVPRGVEIVLAEEARGYR